MNTHAASHTPPTDAREQLARAYADGVVRARFGDKPAVPHPIYLRAWRIAYDAKIADLFGLAYRRAS